MIPKDAFYINIPIMIFITIYISPLGKSGGVFEKSDKQNYLTKLTKSGFTFCYAYLYRENSEPFT